MKIVSILAIVQLNNVLDLELLLDKLNDVEKHQTFNFVHKRFKPENYYVSYYSTGKILIYGLKSFEEIDNVVKIIFNELNNAKIENSVIDVKIGNIVLTHTLDLNKNLDFEQILLSLDSSSASYEPEQFPAILYKDENNINYTIFANGKLIITGVKDLKLVKMGLTELIQIIKDS